MVNKKTEVKVTGGMDPKWRSTVRKSREVSAVTKEKAQEILDEATDILEVAYPDSGFMFHYKLVTLKDSGWGETHLIIPVSTIAKARKNKSVLTSVANRVATRKKQSKKKGD